MKTTGKAVLIIFLCLACFGAGIFIGTTHGSAGKDAQYLMAVRLYTDIKETYGGVRYDHPDYKNVVGTVHLYKDMDFAIYQQNGVKTLRVYEP